MRAEKAAQAQADVQAVHPTLDGSSPVSPSALDPSKSQAPEPTETKKKGPLFGLPKEQWMLMGALALPVFLETLDYTGACVSTDVSDFSDRCFIL